MSWRITRPAAGAHYRRGLSLGGDALMAHLYAAQVLQSAGHVKDALSITLPAHASGHGTVGLVMIHALGLLLAQRSGLFEDAKRFARASMPAALVAAGVQGVVETVFEALSHGAASARAVDVLDARLARTVERLPLTFRRTVLLWYTTLEAE